VLFLCIFATEMLRSFLCSASKMFGLVTDTISTVNLNGKLDLKAIALQACNAEYDPKVGLLF
jgi:preprotein translocase subunit SecF